jgi:tetratricopeptide (TPR) repeat protein
VPPQVHDLWPDEIRTLFCDLNDCARNGDKAGLARGCRRVERVLRRIEAAGPAPRPLRLQVARSYFDLSFSYQQLGNLRAARRALERARDRWQAAVKTGRGDFYARTQLGACHNLLGLMADDAGDAAAAEGYFLAALDAREEAHNRDVDAGGRVDPTDRCGNLTYRAGTLCNLGHLYRTRGDVRQAARYYAEAIRELHGLVHRHRKEEDREVCAFFARQWEMIHGQPHYTRVAEQFLDNAKWGRAELKKRGKEVRSRRARGRS